MNAPRRAIIFDMDGVLTDSEPLINAAAIAMFKEKGLEVQPSDFLPFVGTGEDRYIGGVAERYQFPLDIPAAKRRTYEIYLELVPSQLEAFAGAVELVHTCRAAGLLVAVASSADRVKIDANLRKIGLPPESWNAIVSGEDVLARKPAPDIFLAAAARLGVSPAECVVMEDAVNGVKAAKAAGMRCLAVAQTFGADQLNEADLVREKISEITVEDLVGLPPVIAESADAIRPGLSPAEEARGPWGPWITLWLTLATGLAVFPVQVAVMFVWVLVNTAQGHHISSKEALSNGSLVSIVTLAGAPVALAVVWLFIRLRKGIGLAEYLALRPVSIRVLLGWTVVFLAVVFGAGWVTSALHQEAGTEFMKDVYRTAGFPPLLWLAVVVAAPVYEEAIFRGFMFKGLLHSRLGAVGAVLVTAGTWAAIHLQYDAYARGTIFVVGLVLGLARLRTNSVYTGLFLHALMNLLGTLEAARA
ncbi:MAG TPA: HAD-IA family hydrolase [Methylomirabilota bacterium]|nr:HAD-IA family hydrolase [Methylomirabilota bacterium]